MNWLSQGAPNSRYVAEYVPSKNANGNGNGNRDRGHREMDFPSPEPNDSARLRGNDVSTSLQMKADAAGVSLEGESGSIAMPVFCNLI